MTKLDRMRALVDTADTVRLCKQQLYEAQAAESRARVEADKDGTDHLKTAEAYIQGHADAVALGLPIPPSVRDVVRERMLDGSPENNVYSPLSDDKVIETAARSLSMLVNRVRSQDEQYTVHSGTPNPTEALNRNEWRLA